MKKFIITVLLLFTLNTVEAQISTSDTKEIIEQVERVGRWSSGNFTVFGILAVVLGGSLVVNYKRAETIRKLNSKIEANLKDHTAGEIEVVYRTLEKYSDLALSQKRDADRMLTGIEEVLGILKRNENGEI